MKRILSVMIYFCVILGLSACRQQSSVKQEERILMINDKLYYGTSETGPMGDSEYVDGEIVSSVEKDKMPTENGQSNFGYVGNSFTKDDGDGEIMVFIEDEWFWFYNKQ